MAPPDADNGHTPKLGSNTATVAPLMPPITADAPALATITSGELMPPPPPDADDDAAARPLEDEVRVGGGDVAARLRLAPGISGASSVFQLDAVFIRAATGPPRLGEGEPLIRRGKVPLSTTSASPITRGNTPTSPRVSGYVREQSSHSNG